MDYNSDIDKINRATYARTAVVSWYDNLHFILKPEEVILKKITPTIKNKKLLDIGIGGGRTTKYLLDISSDYTGIDYTLSCTEVVRSKYPGATIFCCDARDLRVFAKATFDFVLFSFNAIDYMVHEDRIKSLKEIHRVLKSDGLFMFSTHNRDYKYFDKLPWQEEVQLSAGYLKSCLYTLWHLPKHFLMKRHEIHTDEYAIINDTAHGFALLAYYISSKAQIRQLETTGFVDVEAYDMEGNQTENDSAFPWTYYLARRSA
jgi:SAM-dependent methyltransferase